MSQLIIKITVPDNRDAIQYLCIKRPKEGKRQYCKFEIKKDSPRAEYANSLSEAISKGFNRMIEAEKSAMVVEIVRINDTILGLSEVIDVDNARDIPLV